MRIFLVIGLLASLAGCTWFIKPAPKPLFVEQALGDFSFADSTESFSGRFILHAYEEMLAVDLYAYAFPAAMIRFYGDSTLVYLPMTGQLLVMPEEGHIPLEGWKVPIKPVADAYWGGIPDEPDSVTENQDTAYYWKSATAYLRLSGDQKLSGITGADWSLAREGALEGSDRAQRLVFTRKDARFVLEFTSIELKELDPIKVFSLNLPESTEILDYR